MATALNAGFVNNINTIQIRTSATSMQRVTDRSIDFDGDGAEESVTITYISGDATGVPSAPGGKMRNTVTTPTGVARTVIETIVESDGGLNSDRNVAEFTQGTN